MIFFAACRGQCKQKGISAVAAEMPFYFLCSGVNRVLKNKHQAVSQGVRRFGKHSLLINR
jgi:hypothetical protein